MTYIIDCIISVSGSIVRTCEISETGPITKEEVMSKGSGGKGGGKSGGKGGNWPSGTGNPSGGGRGNNPPSKK